MDRATPKTVIGDFDDVEFTRFGTTSRLYRPEGRYTVRTEGPDGEILDQVYVYGPFLSTKCPTRGSAAPTATIHTPRRFG